MSGIEERVYRIRVLCYKEEQGGQASWIAQCLEFDIAGFGPTLDAARASLERTLCAQFTVDVEQGREPFSGIPQCPTEIRDQFFKVVAQKRRSQPLRLPQLSAFPPKVSASLDDLRVYA